MALSDYHAPLPRDKEANLATLVKLELQALMTKSADADLKAKEYRTGFYTLRLPNREFLDSIDNAMRQLVEFGYSAFMSARPTRGLSVGETRKIIETRRPMKDLPFKRVIVLPKGQDAGRYEVGIQILNGVRVRETVHASADLGSVGYPHCLFVFGELPVRGTFAYDRWHVFLCEWDGAIADGHCALSNA